MFTDLHLTGLNKKKPFTSMSMDEYQTSLMKNIQMVENEKNRVNELAKALMCDQREESISYSSSCAEEIEIENTKNKKEKEKPVNVEPIIRVPFDEIGHTQRCGVYISKNNASDAQNIITKRKYIEKNQRAEGYMSSESPSLRGHRNSSCESSLSGKKKRKRRRKNGSSGGDDSEQSENSSRRKINDMEKEMDVVQSMMADHNKRVKESVNAMRNCFGCKYFGLEDGKVYQSDVAALEGFFDEFYGKMDNDALASAMEDIFVKKIYNQYRRKGIKIQMWTKEEIKEHFLHHILDPDIAMTEMLRMFTQTLMEMRNGFFTERKITKYIEDENNIDPETGEFVKYKHVEKYWEPDLRVIKCAIDVGKFIRESFKMGSKDFAPERRRMRVKNMQPSMVSAATIQF